jgi:hypothetical protein
MAWFSASALRTRAFRAAAPAFFTMVLAGCHADMTVRLDVHPDGNGTVTLREAMDDQFFGLARSQSSDPFGIDQAKREGWEVRQTLEDSGTHVITLLHAFRSGDAGDALGATPLGRQSTMRGISLDQRSTPFFSTVRVRTTIPRLMPEDRSNNAWAGAAAGMMSSIVSMHLVIATPGHVDETNGEIATDGSVHWNLSLTEPTTVTLAVTYVNWPGIVLAALVLVAAGVAGVVVLRRRNGVSGAFAP